MLTLFENPKNNYTKGTSGSAAGECDGRSPHDRIAILRWHTDASRKHWGRNGMSDNKIMLEVRDMKRDYHIPWRHLNRQDGHAVKGVSFRSWRPARRASSRRRLRQVYPCPHADLHRRAHISELFIDGEKMDTSGH